MYTPVGAVMSERASGGRAPFREGAGAGGRNHFYSEEGGEDSGVVYSRLPQSESGGEEGELPPNLLASVNKSFKSENGPKLPKVD